jgi:hypothetical protein
MTARDRAWLRTFLHLDRRVGTAVRRHDVERQEVVLADEVGMGKTYEALGVLAACLQSVPAPVR